MRIWRKKTGRPSVSQVTKPPEKIGDREKRERGEQPVDCVLHAELPAVTVGGPGRDEREASEMLHLRQSGIRSKSRGTIASGCRDPRSDE